MSPRPLVAICPGSFDPITLGHESIVRRALGLADRVVVAVARNPSRQKQGLFAIAERLEMLRETFADEPRIEAEEFTGLLVDFARSRGATLVVRGLRGAADLEYELQMALMNRDLLPELETIFLPPRADSFFVSASLVREISSLGGDVSRYVSPAVLARLSDRFRSDSR